MDTNDDKKKQCCDEGVNEDIDHNNAVIISVS